MSQCRRFIDGTLRNKLQRNETKITNFIFKEVHWKILSAQWQPFCWDSSGGSFTRPWISSITCPLSSVESVKSSRVYWCIKINICNTRSLVVLMLVTLRDQESLLYTAWSVNKLPLYPQTYVSSAWFTESCRGCICSFTSLTARHMWPTWGPSGADRTQVVPMFAPWTLLSGTIMHAIPFYSSLLKELPKLLCAMKHYNSTTLLM